MRNEGFKRTILHNAVNPNQHYISVPFVNFLLRLDHTHNLGVALHKDSKGQTALEGGWSSWTMKEDWPEAIYWEEIMQNLVVHTHSQIAQSTKIDLSKPVEMPAPAASSTQSSTPVVDLNAASPVVFPTPQAASTPKDTSRVTSNQKKKNGILNFFSLILKMFFAPFAFILKLLFKG